MNSAPELDDHSKIRPRVGLVVLSLVIAVALYATDQITKHWVIATLPEGGVVPVIDGFLQWHFVRNPGAAFSFASGFTWVFTILSAAVACLIIWQFRRLGSVWWAVFLGLLLGGVLGNLTDRLIQEPGFPVGHVIDFISTPWMMPAIYNVADIGVVSGMCLFVLISIIGIGVTGIRRSHEPGDGDSETSDETAPGESDARA